MQTGAELVLEDDAADCDAELEGRRIRVSGEGSGKCRAPTFAFWGKEVEGDVKRGGLRLDRRSGRR